jgi:cyanophycinase
MVPKGKLLIIGGAVDLGSSLNYNENISHPNYVKFFELGNSQADYQGIS